MRETVGRDTGRTTGRTCHHSRHARAAAGRVVVAASVGTCIVPAGAVPGESGDPGANRFVVTVLSSRAEQVSGGDALVQVTLPRGTAVEDLRVDVNGADVTAAFADPEGDGTAVGLVKGWSTARTRCGR